MVQSIKSDKAPEAIGPYSQAIRAGDFVYCSGQLGIDRGTGNFASDSAAGQATKCIQNLREVLAAAGLGLKDVVKTTIFLADIADFGSVNEAYGKEFTEMKPARSTVQVAALPKGGRVEIEAIAFAGH